MQNPFGDESRLNRFILISVVLHAILFFAIPNIESLLQVDAPGLAGGGVIQVMHVETSVNPRPSPVTNRLSQTTVPRVTEPRPQAEQPPQQQAIAQPQVPAIPEPQVEQPKPAEQIQEVEPEPAAPEVPEVPDEPGRGELLTSPDGPEVVVEAETREEVQPPVEAPPEPEPRPASQHASGTGTGTEGASDELGVTESGEGTAETAPPAPPPPASGRELHGGGGIPTYPKNAEHDGVEGVVFVSIEVSATGVLQKVALDKSSGDERLDFQAVRYIEGVWTFASQSYDYRMQVAVVFSREDNRFVSNVEYGEVSWLNAP